MQAGFPGGSRGARIAGFSLIELIAVLAIMAIIAGIGVSKYASAVGNRGLESAVQRVVADLELARAKAKALGANRTVSVQVNTGRYTLNQVPDINRPGQTYTVDLSLEPYRASISATNLDGAGGTTLTFNGYGMPVLANGASGVSRVSLTLRARGRDVYVYVDTSTGQPYGG